MMMASARTLVNRENGRVPSPPPTTWTSRPVRGVSLQRFLLCQESAVPVFKRSTRYGLFRRLAGTTYFEIATSPSHPSPLIAPVLSPYTQDPAQKPTYPLRCAAASSWEGTSSQTWQSGGRGAQVLPTSLYSPDSSSSPPTGVRPVNRIIVVSGNHYTPPPPWPTHPLSPLPLSSSHLIFPAAPRTYRFLSRVAPAIHHRPPNGLGQNCKLGSPAD
ncbi:hypothetical protein BDK51DRAFT_38522 [Blyttiomyces helicus]|uniref:Uncharacterized protein n=1 Tax=Blyttiomyces helicus TaxID=388810 RepID=A0A4P9WB26_9FUNG|nr:hypothetical protein BDK51DRAFT_38522 [Blyttiomyces helicus]|eukprot:RKO89432.1 hypothetical protein BDK51DRAFT_38522 [Blyttiomyces helicus]